jgi:predicted nucleotidyltransferase
MHALAAFVMFKLIIESVPVKGTIVPIMGTTADNSVAGKGLFGRTRAAVLAELYGHADQSFYVRQLARAVSGGHGALQRELQRLTEMGIILRTTQGNQVLYQANSQSPIFSEIKGLIAKTVGVRDVIRSSLASSGQAIQIAFVYGSVARQQEQANSDVDLMVLGNASFGEVVSALGPAQRTLAREINPTVFAFDEFRSKLASGNHFLRSLMKERKLFVLGTENELAKLASKQLVGTARNKS